MVTGPEEYETWRDKYLNALDRQEALERQADEQYQLMRRLLMHLSLVADGRDPGVDAILDDLRPLLRGETGLRDETGGDGLSSIAERLDKSVRGFEDARDHLDNDILSALTILVSQLRGTSPSRELKHDLNQYLSKLPMLSQKLSLFPALLQQLAELQQRVLEQTKVPRKGFLGLRRTAGSDDASGVDSGALEADIRQALEQVLSAVHSEHTEEDRVATLRQQLNDGLSIHEVPGVLVSLRDLLMRSWMSFNQVFGRYLNNVNTELEEIAELLRGAADRGAQWQGASQSLTRQVNEQCSALEDCMHNAADLDQLKHQVSAHLGQIREGIQHFRRQGGEESPSSSELAQLAQRIRQMEEEAEQSRASLQRHRHKALHDPLTQLPNREAYEERLLLEISRWKRSGRPLTLAICDVDYFKRINDQFGHQAGDRVLKLISRAIGRRLREVDFLGRYGGEEFVMLLPETRVEDAFRLLDELRGALAETAFNYHKEPMTLTLSMGLTEFREGDTAHTAFTRADQALYAAKAAGRNRCQIG